MQEQVMYISNNYQTFKGKKEILYGLAKAATNVRKQEIYNRIYANRMSHAERIAIQETSAKAYIDCAMHDAEFVTSVKGFSKQDLFLIKKELSEFHTERGVIEPLEKFSELILDNINSFSGKTKNAISQSVAELLIKLKS